MSSKFWLLAALIIGITVVPVLAAEYEEESVEIDSSQQQSMDQQGMEDDGMDGATMEEEVIVEEDGMDGGTGMESDRPVIQSLQQAVQQFQAQQYDQSADSVQKAAELLRTRSQEVTGEASQILQKGADKLDALSEKIRSQDVQEIQELKQRLATAHTSLANFHLQNARDYQRQGMNEQAGQQLQLATQRLEDAWKDLGAQPDKSQQKIIDSSRDASQQMAQGQEVSSKDADKCMKDLEKEINEVQKKIDSM